MRVVEDGASFMSMLTRKLVNGKHAQAQDVRNENGNFPIFLLLLLRLCHFYSRLFFFALASASSSACLL